MVLTTATKRTFDTVSSGYSVDVKFGGDLNRRPGNAWESESEFCWGDSRCGDACGGPNWRGQFQPALDWILYQAAL